MDLRQLEQRIYELAQEQARLAERIKVIKVILYSFLTVVAGGLVSFIMRLYERLQ